MSKGWWRLWFPHNSRWDSRRKKEAKEDQIKNERKREKGHCYYPFSTLVLQSRTLIFMIECLLFCHFHILVGIFIVEPGLYIPMMGILKILQVFMSKRVGCTHTYFLFDLSYTYSSSVSVAWQSLLLALTSIDGHLPRPLISRVNVRLSPFLSSPHNPHHHLLFHP